MNTNVLSRSDRESVAILTLERPAKLNALNYELVDSIVQALDQIEVEEQIRAAPADWPWSHKRWKLKKPLYGNG